MHRAIMGLCQTHCLRKMNACSATRLAKRGQQTNENRLTS